MITFQNVTKRYRDHDAVRNISLEIPAGKTVVFAGPSGCGKTTLLKIVNRLVQPTEGHVFINGKDINEQNIIKLRRQMGYVIQQTGLFPHMTVRENITIIPKLEKMRKNELDNRLSELFDITGLEPSCENRYPHQLSGGQQQRVGVARALANNPEIILMDEPFSALDPITKSQLQDEIINIQSTLKKTVLFVTHDMSEAVKVADLICMMKDGEILQYDTPENILKNPANSFVSEFVGKNRIWSSPELIKVEDIMFTAPPTCYPSSNLVRCIEKMREYRADYLFVIDRLGNFLGYISARKIQTYDNMNIPVHEIMNKDFPKVSPDDSILDLMKIFQNEKINKIPVVQQNRLRGVITSGGLLSVLSKQYTDEGTSLNGGYL